MALLKINFNDPLMKALKAVNSIAGKSLTEEDLKRQRAGMEMAGRLAAPTSDVSVEAFTVGDVHCEWIKPDFAHNPQYVILYAHGGGYTCGGLAYARILAAKFAVATGFSVVSFEYRLAPEHKYPAALDDGFHIWNYLMDRGYGARQVLFAGDSAGRRSSSRLSRQARRPRGRTPHRGSRRRSHTRVQPGTPTPRR